MFITNGKYRAIMLENSILKGNVAIADASAKMLTTELKYKKKEHDKECKRLECYAKAIAAQYHNARLELQLTKDTLEQLRKDNADLKKTLVTVVTTENLDRADNILDKKRVTTEAPYIKDQEG
jgi:hypothetical protein